MGALLVVLVLFSRAVKEGVVPEADGGRAELEQELEAARDGLAWRAEQLEGVRQRTAEDLARARMQLAGVEENARALEDEMAKLERMAAALESGTGAKAADDAALRELEARLASARESLDKARAEQRTKPPAYAVVPFAGRNGTHRRPLYIECAGDGVFLQPENIRLGPADFQGPPGPGNPLASGLRAAREHILVAQGGSTDPAMQPYPLLIVRPSGVMAYYAAREAIQSWGSDFGYQLVDEDWTLAFPPADPTLAQVEKRAIEESRQRLAWLAEVRPTRPVKQPRQYRAAQTRGGVVSDEGPSVLGDQSRWDWAHGGADAAGSHAGRGGGGDALGNGRGTGGSGLAPDGQQGNAEGRFRQSVFTAGSGGGNGPGSSRAESAQAGGADFNGPGVIGPSGLGSRDSGGDPVVGGTAAGTGGTAAGGMAAGRRGAGGRDGGQGGSSTPPAGAAASGGLASSGSGAGGSASADAAGGAASSSASGGSAGGGSGPAMPGLAKTAGGGQPGASAGGSSASASVSMAQSRGKNWASLATQDRPIPLTRPIRLECASDEFRIMDDTGRRVQDRIPIDGDTALAVDPLVKAVHARVETWGLAGDRMYWKPVLVLSQTADGRSRREDLERLLADSGLEARSADGRDLIKPLPPVERAAAAVPR
jgi:hypothetical protein